MYNIRKIIDFSAWTGNWPFVFLGNSTLDSLKKKLEAQNIVKAFVSPIETILERDPMRANRKLLSDLHDCNDDFFSPVPVIDLSYENWTEIAELAVKDKRVRMVKLIPSYHNYELTNEKLKELVDITQKNKLIIALQMRIEDTRGQYPLMKIPDLNILSIVRVLSAFPDQMFIINNLYYSEVPPVLHSLNNVFIDISSIEWQNVLHLLHDSYTLDRFLFSSHCAFYYPEGNTFKLKYSDLEESELDKVAFRNGEDLLGTMKR